MKCIRELGYGTNAKVINGTTSRVWRSDASGLPAPSNGSFYSDLGFQTLWEESRAQPGEAGIITNFLGGKAGLAEESAALDTFRSGLAKMSPKMAESLDPAAVASFFWARYPFTLGSYAGAKPGQYTTLLGGGGGTRSWRPAAIRRRAYERGRSWLHERRRRKRKPGRRRAYRDPGTQRLSVSPKRCLGHPGTPAP